MSDAAQTFECNSQPRIKRYGFGVAAVCLGFWFFDFVMRGWFGGTPSLAVSLRHTFIIAVCLVFVVGFLIKDSLQKIRIDEEGIAAEEPGGSRTSMKWSDIVSAAVEPKRIVCRSGEGKNLAIPRTLGNPNDFVASVERYAGKSHALAEALRSTFIDESHA